MKDSLKVGIVGCGAIGSSLARVITADFKKEARLVALYDIDKDKAGRLSKLIGKDISTGLKQLIAKSDLVIEAASAKSSLAITKEALKRGRSVMVMSVGGIVEHAGELELLALRHRSRVYVPSGAISGIDALKAANIGKIRKVTITTRKNPLSFKGVDYVVRKKIDLDKIKGERLLFSGLAKEAVKYFPQNINVAAVLSLAGIGSANTRVRIIASSRAKRNIHEIEIVSDSGRVFTRTENVLHPDNPKTSYLAVLSAIATLKQVLTPVRIGT
jgi:aspartate dehydrogenase